MLATRLFTVNDSEWGNFKVCVVYEQLDGSWRGDWNVFKGSLYPIGRLFSKVSYNAYQDALRGGSISLIKELGVSPQNAFLKISKTNPEYLRCFHKDDCSMYDKNKCLGNKGNVPACFQAEHEDSDESLLVTEVFSLWRQGVFIIVTPEQDV